jgi:hypothetical protein
VNNIGDEYAGPSPFQLQRTFPVSTSNAVSAPLSLPPTWKITMLPTTSGDMPV